jgi:hypothetical protein
MLIMAIWWLGILLEALLLFRAFQDNLFRRYPLFYVYILSVFATELVRFSVFRWHTEYYVDIYWTTQFLSLLIGSAVIFEVYRIGLGPFPGAARMARNLLLVVFTGVFVKALANPSGGTLWWLAETSEAVERNLRVVQALAILTLVSLFLWYAIPFGRNLRGILSGYGLFIAMSVVRLELVPYYSEIKIFWPYIQAISYLMVLGLWVSTLWSTEPVPEANGVLQLEKDYQALVASTRTQFQRTLTRLGWMARA